MTDDELLQRHFPHAPKPGDRILMRFPEPHEPQKIDPAWYPGIVVRAYVRSEGEGADLVHKCYLSAAVFVDFLAHPPRPRGGNYTGLGGPVLTCMDLRPFDADIPGKGGYRVQR